jgi:exosortase
LASSLTDDQAIKAIVGDLPATGSRSASIRSFASSQVLWAGLTIVLATGFAFWELIKTLPPLYLDSDGYYSHGLLIPLISAYIVYRNWPRLRQIPVRPAPMAIVPLLFALFVLRPATATSMLSVLSVLMVGTLLCGVAFVAGWRWMMGLAPPILYLLMGLPVWSMAINNYTNPLQLLSTRVAAAMLGVTGFHPFQDGTTINLNHYILDVGVPCSGLKLTVALSAFAIFFMLVVRLRWWANVALIAMILPLALLFNGLRITMVGMVGETWGDAAGRTFHDYSGYIMLVACFLFLRVLVRWLGWKE